MLLAPSSKASVGSTVRGDPSCAPRLKQKASAPNASAEKKEALPAWASPKGSPGGGGGSKPFQRPAPCTIQRAPPGEAVLVEIVKGTHAKLLQWGAQPSQTLRHWRRWRGCCRL